MLRYSTNASERCNTRETDLTSGFENSLRLFIAFMLPKDVASELAKIQQDIIRRTGIDGKKTPGAFLHITLIFLGNHTESSMQEIARRLSKIVFPDIFLTMQSIEYVSRGMRGLIWASGEQSEPLLELKRSLDMAVAGLPIDQIATSFIPHVTLFRLKGKKRASINDVVSNIRLSIPTFRLQYVSLMRSVQTPSGTTYQELQRFYSAKPS